MEIRRIDFRFDIGKGFLMNFWKKCPLLIVLALSGILITIAGAVNRNGIYSGYERKTVMTPVLAAVFEGIKEKKYPWQKAEEECLALPAAEGPAGEAFLKKEEPDKSGMDEPGDRETPAQEAASEAEALETAGEEAETVTEAGPKEDDGPQTVYEETADGSLAPAETEYTKEAAPGGEVTGPAEETAPDAEAASAGRIFSIGRVEEDYFEDALFIGDSRTQGLYEYGGFGENVTFYCKTSLTVYDLFKKGKAFIEEEGERITLEQALTKHTFGKIYLMVGINEMGTGTPESFFEEYARAVYRIRQLQPDAVIFVQAIMNVGEKKNASDPIFNNLNIAVRNVELQTLADDKTVFYIDVNEVLCDENGNLFEGWSNDQIHLKAKYYAVWKEFLLNHGAVIDGT